MIQLDQNLGCCDVCELALESAVVCLGPSHVYELYVHPRQIVQQAAFLRKMGLISSASPFAPVWNIRGDPELEGSNFYIRANGKTVGYV